MTQDSPLVRFDSAKLSNSLELQIQGISAERKIQALITSVCVGSTGIWAFTERRSESCTFRFTEATTMPTRPSEIERGLRNIAVDANRQIGPFSADSGLVSQPVSHVRLGGPRSLIFRVIQLVCNHHDHIFKKSNFPNNEFSSSSAPRFSSLSKFSEVTRQVCIAMALMAFLLINSITWSQFSRSLDLMALPTLGERGPLHKLS
jgi:hypothetical protein